MIQTMQYGDKYIETFSDIGVFISPVDKPEQLYVSAIDSVNHVRTYVETDIPINTGDDAEATEQDYMEALESFGVDIDEKTGS